MRKLTRYKEKKLWGDSYTLTHKNEIKTTMKFVLSLNEITNSLQRKL